MKDSLDTTIIVNENLLCILDNTLKKLLPPVPLKEIMKQDLVEYGIDIIVSSNFIQ